MPTAAKKSKKKAATRKPKRKASTGAAGKTTKPPVSLVTGACGFIGTTMVETLHAAGHRIRATDLAEAYARDDRQRGRFPSVLRNLGVDFAPSDVTQPETLRDLVQGVDHVFHIAAIFSYSAPWEALYRVNVEGTRDLCNLLLEQKGFKKLVLWGAGGVYGFPPPEMLPIREEDPKAPPNNYLKSKHEQEQLVMRLGRTRGLRYSIVRPTGVYGPRCVYGMGQTILPLGKPPRIFIPRNFTTRVPLVHVQDVCGAALHLSGTKASDGEAYNLNDDTQVTVVEFMEWMGEMLGKRVTRLPPVPVAPLKALLLGVARIEELVSRHVTHRPTKLEQDTIRYLGVDIAYSNQKLKDAGYVFKYPDAREGLRQTVDWYRAEGWL